MPFKVLKTEQEMQRYRELTYQHIGVLFPMEYLKRSRIVACVDDEKNICGGFVLVRNGPFRVIEQIPKGCSQSLSFNMNKAMELTGLWRTKNWFMSCGTASLWWRFGMELLWSRRRYFLFSYSLKNKRLERIYSIANPKVIYRGSVYLPGMRKPDSESVEMFSYAHIAGILYRSPMFLLARLKPSRWRKSKTFVSVLRKFFTTT